MDITEMQELRKQLERDLAKAASAAVSEFQSRTGLQVDGVSIDMFPVTTIGAPTRTVVGGVRLLVSV